jgi:glutathione synthase
MHVAYERYKNRFLASSSSKPIILFVVQDSERNSVDQRLLEFRLFEQHRIPVLRKSLTALGTITTVDAKTGALVVHDMGASWEVAVVYYRAGYAPTDYLGGPDGIEWQGRAILEKSRATKCPSLGYHLAGTKKVQQELARPGILERFFPSIDDQDKIVALRSVFAGLYSLGADAVAEDYCAIRDVLFSEDGKQRYVLKPQREGGGYNFYNDNLLQKLQQYVTFVHDGANDAIELSKELGEYILMQRLFPPSQIAILLRGGKVEGIGQTISELGCYGTIVADATGNIVHNEYAGFLLRTKFSNVDEGGVASGFATLSSPYLC